MAEQKLVGQNYVVPDLVAKVTGRSKYAEDFRADGMIFAKLLLSPLPHARITRLDVSAAAAMPGVKAILTANPDARRHPGPHGIPLIAHAKAGGAEAATVVEYLEALD